MKYEIFYNEKDNAYCLVGDSQPKKSYNFLTKDSIKINEFVEQNEEIARTKYDELINNHQKTIT